MPLKSPFGAASIASDVMAEIDQGGRTALVTGGYSGLGLVTTKALAAAGAHVVVPPRDLTRAQAALTGLPGAELLPLDLTDAAAVADFTTAFVPAVGRSTC